MIRSGPKLSTPAKRALYGVVSLLWLTGVLWLWLAYGRSGEEESSFLPHPWQPTLLQIHGAAGMVFLIFMGALIVHHVQPGWKQRKHRPTGVSLLVTFGLLSVTGWGLYYVAHEFTREVTSWVHSIVGILIPVILFVHIRLAARRRQ